MNWKRIDSLDDLPRFGETVFLYGKDYNSDYPLAGHLETINKRGNYFYINETGMKTNLITHWAPMVELPKD